MTQSKALGNSFKLRDVVNVKDPAYGAKGDGSADDTAAIQAAINAVSAIGQGTVFLPTGTYAISSALTLQTGVRLLGEGWTRTTIRTSSGTANIIEATSEQVIDIDGMQLSCSVTRTAGSAIALTGCTSYFIRNVRALAPYTFMTLTTCTNGWIEKVNMTTGTGAINGGILLTGCVVTTIRDYYCAYGNSTPAAALLDIAANCDTVTVENINLAPGGGSTGKALCVFIHGVSVPPRWVKLTNCYVEGGTSSGSAEPAYMVSGGTSIQFHNCYASGSLYGLQVTSGNGISFLGGEIFANYQHGALISGGSYVDISHVQIHNNSRASANTSDGIQIGGGVSNFTIIGNTIGGGTDYGSVVNHRYDIRVSAGASDKYRIIGNNCFNGATGFISDAGTGEDKAILGNFPGADNKTNQVENVFIDADTTPSVIKGQFFRFANTGATSVTNFDDGTNFQAIEIEMDGNTTLVNDTNKIRLQGATNWTPGSINAFIKLIRRSGIWFEESRRTP